MKHNISKAPAILLMTVLFSVLFSSCVEHRYYRQNHHHSRHYYERRHMPPPAGVDIEIRH